MSEMRFLEMSVESTLVKILSIKKEDVPDIRVGFSSREEKSLRA